MKYEEFIARFEKQKPTQRGVMVVCPAHDDSPKTPSLSVSKSRDGGVLLKCFANCTAESVVASLGLTMKDLFAEEKAKLFTPPKSRATTPESTERPTIEKIYSYRDSAGREVYQAIRLKPKSFRQRHQVNGAWVWTMEGVERVLYRLPEVLKANVVWIVEGEKDADNLVALGFCATCNVGGAGKWLDAYTESLDGKEVVLCGDGDEPGRAHVKLVFDSIAGTAKNVKVVNLPESTKDVSDYIASFRTNSEASSALSQMASEAHPHIRGVSLPIYTIAELEDDYRRFVRSMDANSFSLGNWLPSLGKLRPLVPGELVFIIGDTGTGKTGLLQGIAKAALPLPTLMFQLELPRELMFERFAAMATKLECCYVEDAYRSADESLSHELNQHLRNLFVCSESRLTVQKIENLIMRAELKIGERPRVVLVDYIQLIGGKGPNRREKISDIAEDLKVMAKATRTIVIVTSQISRNKEEVEPNLHSAKESGSIESSCGLLLAAWRDQKDGRLLHLKVLKSTKGGAGLHVECNFDGPRMMITERSKVEL
jgi:KaiC/GvpD/RAD55 family RecA-like ATPase/5S rRNA maturation endonuclease (ribonuclease M5)